MNIFEKKAHERIEQVKKEKLKELDLGGLALSTIPVDVFELHWLEILRLHFNRIQTIPAEIAQLTQLKELNLVVNQLTNLPEDLAQLERLNLTSNQLKYGFKSYLANRSKDKSNLSFKN